MNNDTLFCVSSAYKTPFGDTSEYKKYIIGTGSMLSGECFSFEVLFTAPENKTTPVSIRVMCELPTKVYRIDNLAVINAANDYMEPGYISNSPGLMPDLLMPRSSVPEIIGRGDSYFEANEENLLNANTFFSSLWVDVNPDGAPINSGIYSINVVMTDLTNNEVIAEKTLNLTVIGAELSENNLIYTNWFHVDSLCAYHKVKKYSDAFYKIFEKYIKNAASHGMTTLLTPMFTPPLDTPIGSLRKNVQLVQIEKKNGEYIFDFSLAEKFIRTAKACGIKVFEHSHLFTQWGAINAPSIYDKSGKLLFGWDTDAQGVKYREFIRSYLRAFLAFCDGIGLSKSELLFHISDEPVTHNKENYKAATSIVGDILKGYRIADALSEPEFYTDGLVKTPIACVDRADDFESVGAECMLYYTCGTYTRYAPNRLISTTSARTRVLGLILYRYNAVGFLHWGYNYYFDRLTSGCFDPKSAPCGYKLLPGASYLVYPTKNGILTSMREKYMREAVSDFRRLKTLEKLIGRDSVFKLCRDCFKTVDCRLIPTDNSVAEFMDKINSLIGENSSKI